MHAPSQAHERDRLGRRVRRTSERIFPILYNFVPAMTQRVFRVDDALFQGMVTDVYEI
jgi:hypothetical protein